MVFSAVAWVVFWGWCGGFSQLLLFSSGEEVSAETEHVCLQRWVIVC